MATLPCVPQPHHSSPVWPDKNCQMSIKVAQSPINCPIWPHCSSLKFCLHKISVFCPFKWSNEKMAKNK